MTAHGGKHWLKLWLLPKTFRSYHLRKEDKMKRTKQNHIVVLVSLLAVLGCAAQRPSLDAQTSSQIKKGISTKTDVSHILGEPDGVTEKDSGEVWMYSDTKYDVDAMSYVPVVGLFAGKKEIKTNTFSVTFDDKGVVREMSRMQQRQDMNMFR